MYVQLLKCTTMPIVMKTCFFFLSYANVLPIERLIISLSILVYTRIYKTSGTLRSEVICRNRIDPAEIISQKVAKSFRE